ncbi:hypothetical protein HYV82_06150 [Candidatus Woesearchaeota archaeon]|nr:hypothetical protein [Candidatus Woesearchaeota archaeon]
MALADLVREVRDSYGEASSVINRLGTVTAPHIFSGIAEKYGLKSVAISTTRIGTGPLLVLSFQPSRQHLPSERFQSRATTALSEIRSYYGVDGIERYESNLSLKREGTGLVTIGFMMVQLNCSSALETLVFSLKRLAEERLPFIAPPLIPMEPPPKYSAKIYAYVDGKVDVPIESVTSAAKSGKIIAVIELLARQLYGWQVQKSAA